MHQSNFKYVNSHHHHRRRMPLGRNRKKSEEEKIDICRKTFRTAKKQLYNFGLLNASSGTVDKSIWYIGYIHCFRFCAHICVASFDRIEIQLSSHISQLIETLVFPLSNVSLHKCLERLTCAFYGQTSRHSRLLARRQVYRRLGFISVYSLECR